MLNINGINTNKVKVVEYRIDEHHSNAYTLWKNIGSPQQPAAEQINELEKAGQLQQIEQIKII